MPENRESSSSPWLFVEVLPSYWWYLWGAVSALVTWSIYHGNSKTKANATISTKPKPALTLLAWQNIVSVSVAIVPFLGYALTGNAWTGSSYAASQRWIIDSRHGVLMATWAVCAVLQSAFYLLGNKNLHRTLGTLSMYALLPAIFVELFTNAAFVFFPDKPTLLARVLFFDPHDEVKEPSLLQIMWCSFPMFYAATTPISLIVYWYLSWTSLQRKDYRMHAFNSSLLLAASLNAGFLRLFIKWIFHYSHCPMYQQNETAVVIQIMAQNTAVLPVLGLLLKIYCAMTPQERGRPTTRYSFYWYLFHVVVAWVTSGLAGVPFWIGCEEQQQQQQQQQPLLGPAPSSTFEL